MRDPVLVLNSIASTSPPSAVISYNDFVFLATLLNWDSPLNLALNDGEKRSLKEWVELMLPASSSSGSEAIASTSTAVPTTPENEPSAEGAPSIESKVVEPPSVAPLPSEPGLATGSAEPSA